MKRHLPLRLFVVVAIALVLNSVLIPVYSQRGEKTVGVAAGYSTYNQSGFANLYFQYSFAQHVRISPEIGYAFPKDGTSGFEASIDMHFPFKIYRGIGVYPLAGVTYNNWSFKNSPKNLSRFGADFGAGFDFYFTSRFKLSVQGKYSLVKTAGGGFVNIGFGYVF